LPPDRRRPPLDYADVHIVSTTVENEGARTDASGQATFTLAFDAGTIRRAFTLSALGTSRSATFFTDAPAARRLR
jgi:hypothetical protein